MRHVTQISQRKLFEARAWRCDSCKQTFVYNGSIGENGDEMYDDAAPSVCPECGRPFDDVDREIEKLHITEFQEAEKFEIPGPAL